jgi:hypothetical protein
MFEKLSNIDTDIYHLTTRLIAFALLTFAIYYLVTPLVFWAIFGEGATSTQVANLTITKVCWTLSATLILFPIMGQRFLANYKKGRLSKAKDYLYVAAFVLMLSGLITYLQIG